MTTDAMIFNNTHNFSISRHLFNIFFFSFIYSLSCSYPFFLIRHVYINKNKINWLLKKKKTASWVLLKVIQQVLIEWSLSFWKLFFVEIVCAGTKWPFLEILEALFKIPFRQITPIDEVFRSGIFHTNILLVVTNTLVSMVKSSVLCSTEVKS